MKNLLFIFVFFLLFLTVENFAQTCTPLPPTGAPGVTPPTENLACAERGIAYNEVIFIENFNAFNTAFGQAQLNLLRIDSVTNMPCDFSWSSNKIDNTFLAAETGCISIFGVTNDSVGQYRVKIFITVDVTVPGIGPLVLSDEAEALVQQVESLTGQPTGVNFKYFLRVIQPGMLCPVLDTTLSANNLLACQVAAPPQPLDVSFELSADTVCNTPNNVISVTTNITGGTPPYSFSWQPAEIFSDSLAENPTITPTESTPITLIVTDADSTIAIFSLPLTVETCTGIENNTAQVIDFTLWPNPTQDVFNIQFSATPLEKIEFSLFALDSKLLIKQSSTTDSNGKIFEVMNSKDLPTGLYFLKITSEKFTVVERILKN